MQDQPNPSPFIAALQRYQSLCDAGQIGTTECLDAFKAVYVLAPYETRVFLAYKAIDLGLLQPPEAITPDGTLLWGRNALAESLGLPLNALPTAGGAASARHLH